MANRRLLRTRGVRRTLLAAGLTLGLVAGGATGILARGDNANAQGTNGITITLDAQPDAAQDFPFDTSGTGISNFVLDDDADPTLSNTISFGDLDDGLYIVAGPDIPGWSLSALTCDTGDDSDTTQPAARSGVSAAAAFRLEGGDQASCTFAYERTGPPLSNLTIIKDVVNDDSGTSVASDFNIHVLSGSDDVDGSPAAGSETGTSYELEAGAYTVIEDAADGYTATYGGDCAPDGTVTLADGVDATCTVTNDDNETGSITIVKEATPADGTDFEFTTTGLGDDFSLDVDDDPTLPNSVTFDNLSAGSYSVTELAKDGWKLVDIVCTGVPVGRNVETPADTTIDIQLAEGAQIICTFVNETERPTGTATLTITKEAGNAVNSEVTFSAEGLFDTSSFTLDDDPATATPDSITFSNLPAGEVTITELAAQGWDLAAITCRGGGTSSDIATATLIANLVDGANVRCTFINMANGDVPTDEGSLTIVKDAGDAEGSEVAFTTTGGLDGDAGFSLDDDATTDMADSITFDELASGTYTVTELAASGWQLASITCTDGADATVDVATGTVSVALGENEDVTCTFVNEPVVAGTGSITIVKQADPADGTDFAFTGVGIGEDGFILDVDDDPAYSESISFSDLAAGNYSVTESVVEGWTLVDVTCTGLPPTLAPEDTSDNTIDISLAEGADIICTFVNVKDDEPSTGSLTIVKDAGDATDSAVTFTTTGGLDGDLGFTLDDDAATNDVLDTMTFSALAAGTYTVTEGAADGWTLSSITCTGGVDVTTDVATGLATINLAEGEDVTCVYLNEADVAATGSLTIVKDAGDATDSAVTFTTTGGLDGDLGFTLDDDAATNDVLDTMTFSALAAGTYTVTEGAADGWTLSSITCTGGADVTTDVATGLATINLAEGEDVICTFLNEADVVEPTTGTITIIKDADDASNSVANFSSTGGLAGDAGFALDDDATTLDVLDTVEFTEVAPGTYTITEAAAQGWILSNITCTGGADVVTDVATGTVTITLAAGEDVTCTFENDPANLSRGPVQNDRRSDIAQRRLLELFEKLRNHPGNSNH